LYGCPRPDAVALCAAGVLTAQDERELRSWLADRFAGAEIGVWADYCGAVAAMREDSTCCVIAGTGSVVASRVGGRFVKSGGCGPLLGDHGSAFDCVRSALEEYLSGGTVGPAVLTALDEHFGATEPAEVVAQTYRSSNPATRLAAMLPALCAGARTDDALRAALVRPMEALAMLTERHVARHHPGVAAPKVETFGGLWAADDLFHNAFAGHLQRLGIQVLHAEFEPVVGATRLALGLLQ
jgi:N-acetylglucosamine kinase-like BadF-type ATPase